MGTYTKTMKLAVQSLALLFSTTLADVPVSCPYAESHGVWEFSIGTQGSDHSLVAECGLDNLGDVTKVHRFLLEERDRVTNLNTGSKGHYTIVSSQGFEITIDQRKYWAYYYFDANDKRNNDCGKTMVGYQRDEQLKTWSCIQGNKVQTSSVGGHHEGDHPIVFPTFDRTYVEDKEFLEKVNNAVTWKAKHYKMFEQYSLDEFQLLHGTEKMPDGYYDDLEATATRLNKARNFKFPVGLPENFDWTNRNGVNYDSPVWDQAGCGSCFAFGAKSVIEGRFRVASGLRNQPIVSAQEIITCGADMNYNQGCSGGFGYLVLKETLEWGVVDESCGEKFEYHYSDKTCPDASGCERLYVTDYEYLGGYYGGATVEMIMQELVDHGSVGVGIYAPSDFHSYESGVYYQSSNTLQSDWNPLVPTNHAVVIVGYGRCPSTITAGDASGCNPGDEDLPYWKVKNSWSASWGESGYIKVLLGVNEIAIESKPVIATPVIPF